MHKFWAIAVGCALSVGIGVAQVSSKIGLVAPGEGQKGEGQQDFVVRPELVFIEKGSNFQRYEQTPWDFFGEYWMTLDVDTLGGKDRLASDPYDIFQIDLPDGVKTWLQDDPHGDKMLLDDDIDEWQGDIDLEAVEFLGDMHQGGYQAIVG